MMNKDIHKLAEQARRKPLGDSWCYRTPEEFEQEFARLLVNECAEVASCNFHVSGYELGTVMKNYFEGLFHDAR
jgi:hypothetical protein